MAGPSKQRTDADNAFLRLQTRSSVRDRIQSETDIVDQARAANTAKLKAQRLEKEEKERAEALANPKSAKRKPPPAVKP